MKFTLLKLGLLFSALILVAPSIRAQGTAFTYQGQLRDGTNLANGNYDLRFTVYDAASNGAIVGGPLTNANVLVSGGVFSVTLDFGPGVFTGASRWLEIGVRAGGSGNFTPLIPRQQLVSAPYAIRAATAPASGLSGTISPANIAAGTITGAMLANGTVNSQHLAAGAVGTAQLAEGAVTANKVFTETNWAAPSHLVTIGNPIEGQFSYFGYSAANIGTDKFVVGAPLDSTFTNSGGAAYVFGAAGNVLSVLKRPNPQSSDEFGWAVAAVGSDKVLVGAPGVRSGSLFDAGAADLFDGNGNHLASFAAPAPESNSEFGRTVTAVGTNRVLIGEPGASNEIGQAHLFDLAGNLVMTVTNPTPNLNHAFGFSVAGLGVDKFAISSPGDGGGVTNGGVVHVFDLAGNLLATCVSPVTQQLEGFGWTLAAVGSDKLLIASLQQVNAIGSLVGVAYLFDVSGNLLTTFANPTPAAADRFGAALAAFGEDKVIISALYDDLGAPDTGTAYVFALTGELIATIGNPAASEVGLFGQAVVALGANRMVVTALNTPTASNSLGAAYIFTFTGYAPGLLADGVRGGSIGSINLADGAVTAPKIADNSVQASKLPSGVVNTDHLANSTVTTAKLTNSAVTAEKILQVTDWAQPLGSITVTNPAAAPSSDQFGSIMAPFGPTRVLVGGLQTEATYIYGLNGFLQRTINNPTPSSGDRFGSALAGLGDERLIVGAPGDDVGGNNAGVVHLFRRNNGALLLTITNPAPNVDDNFGSTVAAIGTNLIAIGALGDDVGAVDAGAVHLFDTNGVFQRTLANPAPSAGDYFSFALASLRTDLLLIGAHGEDAPQTDSGRAYLFHTNGTLMTTLTNPAPGSSNWFGYSVATIPPDKLIVGAPNNDTAGSNAGAAYLFSTNGTLLSTFLKPQAAPGDNFGISVAALGTSQVLIGATGDDTGAANAGAAYVFDLAGNWQATLPNPVPASSDFFGSAVAGVGTGMVAIGVPGDDTPFSNSGGVFLVPFASYAPDVLAEGVRAGSINTVHLIDGAVTADKIGGVLYASQIPELDASKIATGTLHPDRIPGLDASKITSGTLSDARLSSFVAMRNQNNAFLANQSFPLGSAANPSVSFNGDDDTGLFRPTANTLAVTTGGAERLRVDASGNVGIGETAPDGQLHITGPQTSPQIKIETTANNSFVKLRLESFGKPYWDFAVGGSANVMNWFYSATSQNLMSLSTNGTLTTVGPVNPPSDRNVKQDFAFVNPQEVLEKVASLPIQSWAYKNSPDTRHIGPVAQDFHAAFGLNGADDKHISTVDADGVALAAIQGLNQKMEHGVQSAEREIGLLKSENAELKARVKKLEQLITENFREDAKGYTRSPEAK